MTFEKNYKPKICIFNWKISYFIGIPVKCISCQIFNKIVENQDLYKNKDEFWKKNERKNPIFLFKRFYILLVYL